MSRKLANDYRRARIQRRVAAGDDPEQIQKDEAAAYVGIDQVVPSEAQLYSVYEFASEHEENARIYELFETQVGVAVLSGMTEDQMAACVLSPTDGLPISTSRFLDIFGDYLEHAEARIILRNNSELFQTALTGEKGDRVRAQVFIAERKAGWIQKKETKAEITLQAKIETEERVTVTRTNVFAALDKLADQLRDSGKTIDAEGFLRDADAENALIPTLTAFDDGLSNGKATMLNVKKTAVLPPLPKKPKWDAEAK
ncbi:hypothetical protein [Aureimonas sp. AU40]|uniref:hypothetical protein n=1 Tax=Aureimonas sp. AU40 TaxID=1637747 RepID=UPI00078246AB|nr:hypothetical protein [Aureimonas sp. AU40]